MKKLILLALLLLSSCTEEQRKQLDKDEEERHRAFIAPFNEYRAAGGIPYLRYRGDANHIPYYGGCDFPNRPSSNTSNTERGK